MIFAEIIIIVGGLLFGLILDKVFIHKLEKITQKTSWKGDDVIIKALKGKTFWLIFLISLYITLTITTKIPYVDFLKKIVFVIILLFITFVIAKILGNLVDIYLADVSSVIAKTSLINILLKIVLFVIAGLIILDYFGISITPIITGLGIGGLAVALALQETLSNLFAGLQVLVARQIRPGDYIKLESGEEGYVLDVTWRNTVIRALPNNLIIIPNSKLANSIVVNYYKPEKELSVVIKVGVSYDSDLEKVEQVVVEVAKEVLQKIPGGVKEFEPFIRYHTFNDFSIDFSVILRAKEYVDQYLLKHEFIKALHKKFQQEGIEIPFPIRTVYLKKES